MTFDEYQPRSAKCEGCTRIFLKNEHRDHFCTGCARRKRVDNGMDMCVRCFQAFDRFVRMTAERVRVAS
jgi:Zn finger protein HypA/HybF involved in hydrogenase expression